MNIEILEEMLYHSYTKETCVTTMQNDWQKSNPTLGHGAVVALIVNDYFGGKIMHTITPNYSHYYNMIDGQIVDLTKEQFLDAIVNYEIGEERNREYLLSNEDTKNRYLLLTKNLNKSFEWYGTKDYFLRDENDLVYRTKIPGKFGGNKKLKIYGKLDCTSAKKWLEKGYYKDNRVFFDSEETAIKAGYRPCAKCMPKEYALWKKNELIKEDEEEFDLGEGNAMKFYLLATKLKYKIRSGWDESHWNVKNERIESIAEHVYGTCILAIALNSEYKLKLDMEKVLKMLVIHEIGEVLIGDITPFDNITPKEKEEIEHEAIMNVLGDLQDKDELYQLLIEFDEHQSKEALFAYLCDKLEADIQDKVYQDMGCQRSLNDQENNVVFKSDKIKEIIDHGAETAFDVWYEWDKEKYEDEPVFARTLKYIKNNNLYKK